MKTVFLKALDKQVGDKMFKGANAGDMLMFLGEVKRRNLELGRNVKFKLLKEAGIINDIAMNNFNVINGLDRCLGRLGKSNEKYKAFLKVLSRTEDEKKLEKWGRLANGSKPMDHAIGVGVRDGGVKMLCDNGLYSIADRMCDTKLCYAVDLWGEYMCFF